MDGFPPGGWGIDDLEDVGDWTKELRMLDGSRSLRKLIMDLKSFSARITGACEPLQFDDEGTPGPVKPEPSPKSIRVMRKDTAAPAPAVPVSFVVIEPKVSDLFQRAEVVM
jgi:hypothetical protein